MQTMHIHSTSEIIPIDNWQDYLRDGEQFLQTALGGLRRRKRVFTPEIIYNLTAMAIEKFIMAYLMKNGDLAENHTMGDLADALERHLGSLPELSERLRFLDTFQEICEIESYNIQAPDDEQTERIVTIGQEVQRLLTPYLQ